MQTYIYKFSHQVNDEENDLVGVVYELVEDTAFTNRREARKAVEAKGHDGQSGQCVFFEFEGEAPATFLIEN